MNVNVCGDVQCDEASNDTADAAAAAAAAGEQTIELSSAMTQQQQQNSTQTMTAAEPDNVLTNSPPPPPVSKPADQRLVPLDLQPFLRYTQPVVPSALLPLRSVNVRYWRRAAVLRRDIVVIYI